jgi:hypothetical protein
VLSAVDEDDRDPIPIRLDESRITIDVHHVEALAKLRGDLPDDHQRVIAEVTADPGQEADPRRRWGR